MLGLALTGELARAGHPRAGPLAAPGPAGHAAVARYVSRGSLAATQRADGWVHAAREAVALYGDKSLPWARVTTMFSRGAHPQQVDLELGEGGQDVEEQGEQTVPIGSVNACRPPLRCAVAR